MRFDAARSKRDRREIEGFRDEKTRISGFAFYHSPFDFHLFFFSSFFFPIFVARSYLSSLFLLIYFWVEFFRLSLADFQLLDSFCSAARRFLANRHAARPTTDCPCLSYLIPPCFCFEEKTAKSFLKLKMLGMQRAKKAGRIDSVSEKWVSLWIVSLSFILS